MSDKPRNRGLSLGTSVVATTLVARDSPRFARCPKWPLSLAAPAREDGGVLEEVIDRGLREIAAARLALDAREAALVVRARSCGATWAELGRSLGVSKQGARKRHLAVDPVFARRAQKVPTIDEYHAEMAAALQARAGER